MKKKFIILGVILLVTIGFLSYTGFKSFATYYYPVSEVQKQGSALYGEKIRVNGTVAAGSVVQEQGSNILRFNVVEGGASLPVVFQGAVPDTFKAEIEVVVEGHLNSNGVFQANTILTKCPSKYVPQK